MIQNLYNANDILRNISKIEIKREHILTFFNDGSICELDFYGCCSRLLSCDRCGKCKVARGGADEIINLIRQKEGFISSYTLKPDWISKVTKSGNGWELFRTGKGS